MDHDARQRFGFFLSAMDRASSQFELTEARREAGTAARDLGLTFDQALRAHRAGWPVAEDESEDAPSPDTSETTIAPAAESAHLLSSEDPAGDDDEEVVSTTSIDGDEVGGAKTPPTEAPAEAANDPPTASEADAWAEPIGRFVARSATVTIGEIATTALGLTGRLGTIDRARIARNLEQLGWARGRKNWKGQISWHPLEPTTDQMPSASSAE